jgi:hypothetical protein
MKAGSGQHFEQSYNAQAAVEVDSRLIVGASQPSAQRQTTTGAHGGGGGRPGGIRGRRPDRQRILQRSGGPGGGTNAAGPAHRDDVYAAVEKKEHHRTVSDLEKEGRPGEVPRRSQPMGEVMKHRLQTAAGKAKYKLRQQTVEPVFGIIKSVLGFRQFLLRGKEKVRLEWQLVCLAYNLKRLHHSSHGDLQNGKSLLRSTGC